MTNPTKQRRRISKGRLVASTNPQKQELINRTVDNLTTAYKQYGILSSLLLTFMQIHTLNH
jgi:hypothetical protein